ncbi:hypothetical protein HJFPF1_10166 [Paramyrothecium foliicola]|nr:hypothetical protein HJFPF1_10166 [Paramyrothecium foliicola]
MPRTNLANKSDLLIDEGGVLIPGTRDADHSVILVFRQGANASTGLHWHEEKTEYLQVLQGHALVTVGDRTGVFGPDDGTITVPRFTLHQFSRADNTPEGAASKDVELRVKEWTDPPDFAKEIFFRNMLGVIIDRQTGIWGNLKALLSIFVIMNEHDNYPVFANGPSFLGPAAQSFIRRKFTYATLGVISFIGRSLGFKGTYDEYTSEAIVKKRS